MKNQAAHNNLPTIWTWLEIHKIVKGEKQRILEQTHHVGHMAWKEFETNKLN